ncbi:hypothetical protein Asp14428_35360 [Actinoplanes sp. NBRC 14428]|nr:hypothetical protein Asp14428_35360 [Actinoplanes sp. NBRC 14428]
MLSWADVLQAVVAGGAGMLGVYSAEGALRSLRRRGVCPGQWTRSRSFLVQRDESRLTAD